MDVNTNKSPVRPLYISVLKGFVVGILAILLKLLVSFSVWQKTVSNGSYAELENYVIFIIIFATSLLVYNSVIMLSMNFDVSARDELMDATYDTRSNMPPFTRIFSYKSFFTESLSVSITIALAAAMGASGEIFGMFHFGEGKAAHSSGFLPMLITFVMVFLQCVFARYEAVRYWKYLYRTSNLEQSESKIRLFLRLLFIVILYPIALPYLPYLVFVVVTAASFVVSIAVKMTVPVFILTIASLLIGIRLLRIYIAIIKRKRFFKKLKTEARAAGYDISKIKNPYASLFSLKRKCSFRLESRKNTFECIVLGYPKYRVPICFTSECEGYYRHSIGIERHNITFQSKFDYQTEGDGKKIIIICPPPKDAFVSEGDKERRLFNSDKLWEGVIYEDASFIAAIQRDCLGRYDSIGS